MVTETLLFRDMVPDAPQWDITRSRSRPGVAVHTWVVVSGGNDFVGQPLNNILHFLVHVFLSMPSQEGGVNIHAMIWYIMLLSWLVRLT